jgi:hypothetical protein
LSVEDELYASSGAWLTLTAGKTKDTLKVYPAEYVTPELAATRTRWRRPGARFSCSAETEVQHARDERLPGPLGKFFHQAPRRTSPGAQSLLLAKTEAPFLGNTPRECLLWGGGGYR